MSAVWIVVSNPKRGAGGMKYRVLLIDDDRKRIKALKEHWASVFAEARMEVQITEKTEFDIDDDYLLERPHFVIVDNVLKQEHESGRTIEIENRGIDFIADHKPQHLD